MSKSYTWEDFDEIFGLDSKNTQSLADEYLAVTLELTIAIPQNIKEYKTLTLLEKINVYRNLFDNFKTEYNSISGAYQIEYHQNGNPHLHGYIEVLLHPNTFNYPTVEILRMFAKSIFLMMPRSVFRQFRTADVNEHLKRFKSPAVVINIKNLLSKEWVNYINKNAA